MDTGCLKTPTPTSRQLRGAKLSHGLLFDSPPPPAVRRTEAHRAQAANERSPACRPSRGPSRSCPVSARHPVWRGSRLSEVNQTMSRLAGGGGMPWAEASSMPLPKASHSRNPRTNGRRFPRARHRSPQRSNAIPLPLRKFSYTTHIRVPILVRSRGRAEGWRTWSHANVLPGSTSRAPTSSSLRQVSAATCVRTERATAQGETAALAAIVVYRARLAGADRIDRCGASSRLART